MFASRTLILTAVPGIPLIQSGDDLTAAILAAIVRAEIRLAEGDILVLAQKIVSKAEGRVVRLDSVEPSPRARELGRITEKDPRIVELVLRESREVLRARKGLLVVEHKLGFVCANAGIDRSNVGGQEDGERVLLLPENPDRSCAEIRKQIREQTGAAVGVLINDSHGRAWRNGTVGVAIGIAGVPGVENLRGKPDLFEYRLQSTDLGAADELAAAASLIMGQADEGTPVVHARGFPYPAREGSMRELLRKKEEDAFR